MGLDITRADVWQVDATITGLFHLFSVSLIRPEEVVHHVTGQV